MKIVSERRVVEHNENLPQIIQRIFSVCKTDPSFPLRGKIKQIDSEITSIRNKLIEQESLLRKSREAKKNLLTRVNLLTQKNIELKEELLEQLGSGAI